MSSDITFIQKKVVEYFQLNTQYKSAKGWIYGGKCPWCNNSDKFGIKLNQTTAQYKNQISFNCFHGSCQQKGSEFKLLNQIELGHLLKHGEFIGDKEKIKNTLFVEEQKQDIEVEEVSLPLGFRRVLSDPYLEGRGFESWQFQYYIVGRTTWYAPLKDYVLFSITEGGKHKGYIGRSTWDKQRMDDYNASIKLFNTTCDKENRKREHVKFNNEGGVDFGKLLFGYDEVTENTEEIILVEGVTDKANVDRLLRLDKSEKLKCLCTFGKKISESQIRKLKAKGISKVILMYDPDAIDESKKYSIELELWDIRVKVGYLPEKDPGDLNREELTTVLSQTQTPNQFATSKMQKRKLGK